MLSALLRAGHSLTAGLSYLSTADSILISSRYHPPPILTLDTRVDWFHRIQKKPCYRSQNRFFSPFLIKAFGLTACSGDSWRDTVENPPMLVCVHACGGTDGACHAA